MDEIQSINKQKLAEHLAVWFNSVNLIDDPNIWKRDPVAEIIKRELKRSGRWRNRSRGDCQKGYKAYKEKEKVKKAGDDW